MRIMSDSPSQPPGPHHYDPTAEEAVFDANLQEFAARVGNTCGLESNGKITPHEAYDRIKALWKDLRRTKKSLLTDPDAK